MGVKHAADCKRGPRKEQDLVSPFSKSDVYVSHWSAVGLVHAGSVPHAISLTKYNLSEAAKKKRLFFFYSQGGPPYAPPIEWSAAAAEETVHPVKVKANHE